MTNRSNDIGRAYEYAWIVALQKRISALRGVFVCENSSLEANKRAWSSASLDEKIRLEASADSAVDVIMELEPLLEDGNDVVYLSAQKDSNGQAGDVRDIVVSRKDISWEFGLSVKHNHKAVKHSRLSGTLDFGKEWYGIACSGCYWDTVRPVFNDLRLYKSNGIKWSDLDDKSTEVYIPLLKAFIDEIKRAYSKEHNVARKLVEYLVGIYDYYKVIGVDQKKTTYILSFNLHGTLNKPSGAKMSTVSIPIVDLPTRLVAIEMKPNSEIQLKCI